MKFYIMIETMIKYKDGINLTYLKIKRDKNDSIIILTTDEEIANVLDIGFNQYLRKVKKYKAKEFFHEFFFEEQDLKKFITNYLLPIYIFKN